MQPLNSFKHDACLPSKLGPGHIYQEWASYHGVSPFDYRVEQQSAVGRGIYSVQTGNIGCINFYSPIVHIAKHGYYSQYIFDTDNRLASIPYYELVSFCSQYMFRGEFEILPSYQGRGFGGNLMKRAFLYYLADHNRFHRASDISIGYTDNPRVYSICQKLGGFLLDGFGYNLWATNDLLALYGEQNQLPDHIDTISFRSMGVNDSFVTHCRVFADVLKIKCVAYEVCGSPRYPHAGGSVMFIDSGLEGADLEGVLSASIVKEAKYGCAIQIDNISSAEFGESGFQGGLVAVPFSSIWKF